MKVSLPLDRTRKSTCSVALKKKSYVDVDVDDDDLRGIKVEKDSDANLDDSSVVEIESDAALPVTDSGILGTPKKGRRDIFTPQLTPKMSSPVKSKSSIAHTSERRAQCSDASDIAPSYCISYKEVTSDEVDIELHTPTKSKPVPIAKVSKGKLILRPSDIHGDIHTCEAYSGCATLADKDDYEETDDDAMLVSLKSIANMSSNELHALMAMIDASMQTPKTKVDQYMEKNVKKVQSSDKESEGDISPMKIDGAKNGKDYDSSNTNDNNNIADDSDTLEDDDADEDDEDQNHDKKMRKGEVKGKKMFKYIDEDEDEDGNLKVRKSGAKGKRVLREEDKDNEEEADEKVWKNEEKGKRMSTMTMSAEVNTVSDDIKKLMQAYFI
ncbi:hypothetical protein SCP_0202200 [Sparassis crispa]|uniref:Uncharacterized protein n=1 Tax=Sparassis crispa TaxID=139825 RepID=A0A401GA66_9APHY|nr:hypothetical protein SCP_0202200 [Sparassis crispa]GBE79023.1 hypothetical protein SCP_0202200 [Sparassis crispa]